MTRPPFGPVTAEDIATVSAQLGRPARDVVGIAARCVCGAPTVVATAPRLGDGTPFPTLYYLCHPAATAAVSFLEATQVMNEYNELLAEDETVRARYQAAHDSFLADRESLGTVPEIAGHLLRRHAQPGQVPARPGRPFAGRRPRRQPDRRPRPRPLDLDAVRVRVPRLQRAGLGGRVRDAWRRLGVGAAVGLAATLGLGPVVIDAPPARADQVRDLEYWLDDYGFTKAWGTSKGAGVKVADHRHRRRREPARPGRRGRRRHGCLRHRFAERPDPRR